VIRTDSRSFPLRVAAVDMGSNSIRYLAAEFRDRDDWRELDYERVPVRLGHREGDAGLLVEAGMAATVEAMTRFRRRGDAVGVSAWRAVATSAVRESRNGAELVERIHAASGLRLEPIDGREEARLVWRAVASRVDLGERQWLLMDLGGGSLELSLLDRHRIHWSESAPIGTVRLLEELGAEPADVPDYRARITERVRGLGIDGRTAGRGVAGLIATGGNIETLAELADAPVDARGVARLSTAMLASWSRRLGGLSVAERRGALALRDDRADVILPASIVYHEVASLANATQLLVPGVGVKEGVLLDLIDRHLTRADEEDAPAPGHAG